MRATIIAIGLLLLTAGLVPVGIAHDGSVADTQDVSNVHQNDGGSGEDAPDACLQGFEYGPAIGPGDPSEGGQLVYAPHTLETLSGLGDRQDHWHLSLEDLDVGQEVNLSVATRSPARLGTHTGVDVAVTVYESDCSTERAEAILDHDDLAVLNFEIQDPGDHVVELRELDPKLAPQDPGQLTIGPSQASEHCSPYCAFEYQMQVG